MPKAYTHDEIFGEPGSGRRSLHDDGRKFAREVLKVDLGSMTKRKLPSVKKIVAAFRELPPDDEASVALVESLKMTPILVGAHPSVKGTLSGHLWQAAQQVVLFGPEDSSSSDEEEPPTKTAKTSKATRKPKAKKRAPKGSAKRTTTKKKVPPTTAANIPDPTPQIAAPVTTNPTPAAPSANPTANSTTAAPPAAATQEKRGGRKAGCRNWSEEEERAMLELIRELKPTGALMWEKFAAAFLEYGTENYSQVWSRSGEVCKKKFDSLANKRSATGQNVIPVNVALAKQVKFEIDKEEFMGHSSLNDVVVDENGVEGGGTTGIEGTNMFGLDGTGRKRPVTTLRPVPKKAKIADGLNSVANNIKTAGGDLNGCLRDLVGVVEKNLANASPSSVGRSNNIPAAVSADRESRFDKIEGDIADLSGAVHEMHEILVEIKNRRH